MTQSQNPEKCRQRREIDRQTREYIARGGVVTRGPSPGFSGVKRNLVPRVGGGGYKF